MSIKVSIVGASGYSGGELIRLLSRHPHVKLENLAASSNAGKRISDVFPFVHDGVSCTFTKSEAIVNDDSEIVFSALPSGESLSFLPQLAQQGKKIVDLSGDFRLRDSGEYSQFYEREHSASTLLDSFAYGLTEFMRERVAATQCVSNPGCYATSISLALIPLVRDGLIEDDNIVVNSMSGVTGAGRKATHEYSFTEIEGNVKAYKPNEHQHIPEIRQVLHDLTGRSIDFSFVPHLIPINRGIYTTISARLRHGYSLPDIDNCYNSYYANEAFVRYRGQEIPALKNVVHTNRDDIGISYEAATRRLTVFSVLDNLLKGASGQAVQNMNVMMNWNETESLI